GEGVLGGRRGGAWLAGGGALEGAGEVGAEGRGSLGGGGRGGGKSPPPEQIFRVVVLAALLPARPPEKALGRAAPFLTYPCEPEVGVRGGRVPSGRRPRTPSKYAKSMHVSVISHLKRQSLGQKL